MGNIRCEGGERETGHKPYVSMIVVAYNHLDYSRTCIDSLYRNTGGVDFELITVNNGSTDGTREYFNSLAHTKKIDLKQNVGMDKAINLALKQVEGKMTVFISNDLILTPRWLKNMLACMASDPCIGMVVPVCNFSSNYQQVPLQYTGIPQLYEAAENYNISNPALWEDRVRLIGYCFMIPTALFRQLGGMDEAFSPYSFDDDDLSFRVRRAGYRLIVAMDTYIHHYGSVTVKEERGDNALFYRNRALFQRKFGIDAWDDTVIDFDMLDQMDFSPREICVHVLCVTSSCGSTGLQVCNMFRKLQTRVELTYCTPDEKYIPDLQTIGEQAFFAPLEGIAEVLQGNKYDYILLEVDLNNAAHPGRLWADLKGLLQPGGRLIFKVKGECCS